MKKNKAKRLGIGVMGSGEWGAVLHRMVREGLLGKMLSGQRSEEHEGVSLSDTLRKTNPGKESSQM